MLNNVNFIQIHTQTYKEEKWKDKFKDKEEENVCTF